MQVFLTYLQSIEKTKNVSCTSPKATVTESTAAVLWRRSAGTSRSAATTQQPLIRLLWPWDMHWKIYLFFQIPCK